MIKQTLFSRLWIRYVLAVLFVAVAAGARIWPLHALGSTLAWLTFYPAVMAVAIYGGLFAGLFATALSCLIVIFCWSILVEHPFISDLSGWLGMTVFILMSNMISGLAEAMLRSQTRAIKAQEQTEAANIMLKENALALSQYAAIIESSDDAIISKTLDGRITSWNSGADNLFGYNREEMVGRPISILIPEQYKQEEVMLLEKVRYGIAVKHYETVRRCKDGRLIDISVTLSPMRAQDGTIIGASKVARDISEKKKSEMELRIAAATFETHDAIMITDVDANILKVNKAFTEVTGFSQDEVLGKNPRMMNSGLHENIFFEKMFQTVLSVGSWEGEIWDKHKNGEIYPRFMTVTAIKDANQKILSFVGIFHDITEQKKAEDAIRKTEQRIRFILENSPIAVRIASAANGRVVYANPDYGKLIGCSLEQAVGVDTQQFYANQEDYFDIINQLGKGEKVISKLVKLDNKKEIKWVLASFMLTEFENEPAYLGWLYDITERKLLEERVEQLAFYDTLTELPNRRMLNDRLQQAMSANKRSGKYGAVMFMDLDKFKPLNDTHGHVVGDLLLLEVGRRIKSCVREMDTVARFGGDEFVVMLNELDLDEKISKLEAGNVAEKIRTCLAETYFLKPLEGSTAANCVEHNCSSSIGVTLFNGHEGGQETIFKHADDAMYRAKEGGRNLVFFYEDKIS